MERIVRLVTTALLVATVVVGFSAPVWALSLAKGSDYLETLPGTFVDLTALGLGRVDLKGVPIRPGTTVDTIVQRQRDIMFPVMGGSDTIPIEVVALSLQSVAPVTVGTSFFDVFVTLTPGTNSTGQATVTQTGPTGGTFDSFFDVFFDIDVIPVGGGPPLISLSDSAGLVQDNGPWSTNPLPGTVLVEGPYGDQDANLHTGLPEGYADFYVIGTIQETHPLGLLRHVARPAVPEPSAVLLALPGVAAMGALRRLFRKTC